MAKPSQNLQLFFFQKMKVGLQKKIEPTDQRMRHKDLKLLNKYLITYTPTLHALHIKYNKNSIEKLTKHL